MWWQQPCARVVGACAAPMLGCTGMHWDSLGCTEVHWDSLGYTGTN